MNIDDKIDKAFEKNFKKRQYILILMQCVLFSIVLISLLILINLCIIMLPTNNNSIPMGLIKIFSSLNYVLYLKIFIIVTIIVFVPNRNRNNLTNLNKNSEYKQYKIKNESVFKQQERDKNINDILC